MTRGIRRAAAETLAGRRRGLAALWPFLGPAFLASVAYMDPGNVATNIQAGSQFGLKLLWVVVAASGVAMLFQALSARLGIATGRNLAELCRDAVPRPVAWLLWGIIEIAMMATDVAEFLGATVALNLLFGLPLLAGTVVTGMATWLLLLAERQGFRPLEALVGALVAVMGLCYLLEVLIAPPDWGAVAVAAVTPWLNGDSVMLAAGIVGATVMPHALFLHSALTQQRIRPANTAELRRIAGYSDLEVALALGLAGAINVAMLVMAATAFQGSGVADIETAYRSLTPLLGAAAAGVFLAALLASGLSSSVVGTMAGQVVGDHGSDRDHRGHGRGSDPGAGGKPGGAQLRPAGADGRAGGPDRLPRRDGRTGQPPLADRGGGRIRPGGDRPQPCAGGGDIGLRG